jgi:hypothetical protein
MCEISIEFGLSYTMLKGCQGRDRIEVGFTTTCTISAYHYLSCEFESRSLQGILATALCDKACQWLATVQWFSPVSFINKTNCHVITEILWKVILKTISLTPYTMFISWFPIFMHHAAYFLTNILYWPGFTKLDMGLVVLVKKKMSVLIHFLLQNTYLVSALGKIFPYFAGHVWLDWWISWTLIDTYVWDPGATLYDG